MLFIAFVVMCCLFAILWFLVDVSLLGLEGGFDNREPEYEESYNIVILPDFVMLPFPSVELPEKVKMLYVI